MIDAKKLASEEFTVCSELAKEESIASISLRYDVGMSDTDGAANQIIHLSESVEHTAYRK